MMYNSASTSRSENIHHNIHQDGTNNLHVMRTRNQFAHQQSHQTPKSSHQTPKSSQQTPKSSQINAQTPPGGGPQKVFAPSSSQKQTPGSGAKTPGGGNVPGVTPKSSSKTTLANAFWLKLPYGHSWQAHSTSPAELSSAFHSAFTQGNKAHQAGYDWRGYRNVTNESKESLMPLSKSVLSADAFERAVAIASAQSAHAQTAANAPPGAGGVGGRSRLVPTRIS